MSSAANAQCLALSASRRTVGSCIAEVGSQASHWVRALHGGLTSSASGDDVFRDNLVSHVSFQTVFWTKVIDTCGSGASHSGWGQYLVLGFLSGMMEVWLIWPDTGAGDGRGQHPDMTKVLHSKAPFPVACIQLIDDLPVLSANHHGGSNTLAFKSGSHHTLKENEVHRQPHNRDDANGTLQYPQAYRRRFAVSPLDPPSQHTGGGGAVAGITTGTSGGGTSNNVSASLVNNSSTAYRSDALSNVVRVYGHARLKQQGQDEKIQCSHVLQQPYTVLGLKSSVCRTAACWTGTLLVLTVLQIRVYETEQFELRFTISHFQSAVIPAVWQWLMAGSGEPLTAHTSEKAIGPVAALGARWLVFQETISTVMEGHVPQGSQQQNKQPRRQINPVPEDEASSSRSSNKNTAVPAPSPRSQQVNHSSSSWLGRIIHRYLQLPSSQALAHSMSQPAALTARLMSVVPGAFRSACTLQDKGAIAFFPRSFSGNPVVMGGRLTIIDVLTGREVGHVNVTPTQASASVTTEISDTAVSCVDVLDGTWCLSHVESSSHAEHVTDGMTDSTSLPLTSGNTPLMSSIEFDATGTTLFCAEWTGRTVYVCRFRSSESVVEGHACVALRRGRTAGSIVHIAASPNTVGLGSVAILSSRGRCHNFTLPPQFHQSLLSESLSSIWPSSKASRSFLYNAQASTVAQPSCCDVSIDDLPSSDFPSAERSPLKYYLSNGFHRFCRWSHLRNMESSTRCSLSSPLGGHEGVELSWRATFVSRSADDGCGWSLLTVSSDGVVESWIPVIQEEKSLGDVLAQAAVVVTSPPRLKNMLRSGSNGVTTLSSSLRRGSRVLGEQREVIRRRVSALHRRWALSTRDLASITPTDSSFPAIHTSQPSTTSSVYSSVFWSRYCEPITVSSRRTSIDVRFFSAEQDFSKSPDETIVWIRSGQPFPFFIAIEAGGCDPRALQQHVDAHQASRSRELLLFPETIDAALGQPVLPQPSHPKCPSVVPGELSWALEEYVRFQ